MKKIIVLASLLFTAVSTSNIINAYSWPIANQTGENMLIQVELCGDHTSYFFYTKPGQVADFNWQADTGKGGLYLCLVKVIPVTDAIYKKLEEIGGIKDGKVIPDTGNNKIGKWIGELEAKTQDPRKTALVLSEPWAFAGRHGGNKATTDSFKGSYDLTLKKGVSYDPNRYVIYYKAGGDW